MYEWLCKFALKRTGRQFQILLAKDIVEDIQGCTDYSIGNAVAEKIIEAVVKSSGNKVTAFVLKD